MKNVFKARFGGVKTAEDGSIEVVFTVEKSLAGIIKQIAYEIRKAISEGKDTFKVEITEYRNRRSLEQNALMWALLEKMADHMNGGRTGGVTARDCYCDMIEQYGAKFEYLMGLPEAEKMLRENFRAVQFVEKREYNNTLLNVYKCYHGSSTYNTKEMTQLIDGIFDRLVEMGVSDTELYILKDEWAHYEESRSI